MSSKMYSRNVIVRDFCPKEISNNKVKKSKIIAAVELGNLLKFRTVDAHIESVSTEIPDFSINIHHSTYGDLIFQMRFETDRARLISCQVLIMDEAGIWHSGGQDTAQSAENKIEKTYSHFCEFPLILPFSKFSRESFDQNKIILKCKVEYFELVPRELSVANGYELHSSQSLQTSPCVQNIPHFEKKKEEQKSQSTLADDLISLYKEGALCDTTLRAESETFPAHKTILSARSPVFKKMFTNDMKERASDSVDISDINADTLRRLLVFIYTDAITDMEWDNAMELYFAADKYQIDGLKLKCSTFLKSNVHPSNCCDLLLLSDMHQDSELKQFVQGYIIKRDQDIFGSDKWKNFMSNYVELAADTMYCRYARK